MPEAYVKKMLCENCWNSWLQKIPFGYLVATNPNGKPIARKEGGADVKTDFKCPACGTSSKIRWE